MIKIKLPDLQRNSGWIWDNDRNWIERAFSTNNSQVCKSTKKKNKSLRRNIWWSHSQPVQKPKRTKEKHLINEKNQTRNE